MFSSILFIFNVWVKSAKAKIKQGFSFTKLNVVKLAPIFHIYTNIYCPLYLLMTVYNSIVTVIVKLEYKHHKNYNTHNTTATIFHQFSDCEVRIKKSHPF